MLISIKVPDKAKIAFKKGNFVSIGDPLYSSSKKEEVQIDVADRLKIKPDKIFEHLSKIIGEEINKNDILAEKKGFLKNSTIRSPITAAISQISHETGVVTLTKRDKDVKGAKTPSFFKGEIKDIKDNDLYISIEAGTEVKLKNITQDKGGEVLHLKDSNTFFFSSDLCVDNKIVITKKLKSHVIAKLTTLGCRGFLYFESSLDSDIPSAQFTKKEDYENIIIKKHKYCIFSKKDQKGIFYD